MQLIILKIQPPITKIEIQKWLWRKRIYTHIYWRENQQSQRVNQVVEGELRSNVKKI